MWGSVISVAAAFAWGATCPNLAGHYYGERRSPLTQTLDIVIQQTGCTSVDLAESTNGIVTVRQKIILDGEVRVTHDVKRGQIIGKFYRGATYTPTTLDISMIRTFNTLQVVSQISRYFKDALGNLVVESNRGGMSDPTLVHDRWVLEPKP